MVAVASVQVRGRLELRYDRRFSEARAVMVAVASVSVRERLQLGLDRRLCEGPHREAHAAEPARSPIGRHWCVKIYK